MTVFMSRRETISGWIYFCFQLLILPTAITVLFVRLVPGWTEAKINFTYFLMNFLVCVGLFWKFLRGNLEKAAESIGRLSIHVLLGLCGYFCLSGIVSSWIYRIAPDFFNVNDAAIDLISQGELPLMAVGMIAMVPLAEECFYRGLLFQGLYRRSRVLAWIVSVGVFALIHVVGYIGQYDMVTLGLCLLQYIPAGVCLCWAYARTGTIFAPMLIHAIINTMGVATMK